MHSQKQEIDDLQKGGQVQVMYANEGCGGAGDEDANLVDGVVGRVEGTVFREWRGCEWEEESWCNTLVDGVLGNVYEEEWEHAMWVSER